MVLQTDGLDDSCIAAACIAATTALASAGIEMYGLVVGSVALVPSAAEKLPSDRRVLLDPSSADLGLVTGMKTATRVLMCGMPALASVTCLNISAASTATSKAEDQHIATITAGIDTDTLDDALTKVNASLVEIHKVVAQALAEDFQRRTALTESA